MQMKQLHQKWRAFRADQSGQDMIEYALVVGLIALAAIFSMKGLSTSIGNVFNQIVAKVAAVWG
ncbi:MAG: Flp family type IVb pilin [Janthinobacterium lividum]